MRVFACLCVAASAAAPENAPDGGDLELTLAAAVAIALRDNPRLVRARIGRVLEQYDLDEAQEWFWPQLSFGRLQAERFLDSAVRDRGWHLAAGPSVDMRLPTGGRIALLPGWTATIDQAAGTRSEGAGVTFTLSQPLLRGGGLGAGLAPVRLARLDEEGNMLRFKAAVMDVVTTVVGAYRALIEAGLQVDINQRSLERAQETLEVNRLLVETGRMARQDITQTQATIADRELGVVESQIRQDDARRALNVLLDLDGAVRVVPSEPLTAEAVTFDLAESRRLARQNHTGYLTALVDLRRSEIGLMLARNASRWDLSLDASARYAGAADQPGASFDALPGAGEGDYRVALSLSIPISGTESRRMRRERLRAELAMQDAQNAVASVSREMDIAVRNAVRNVETGIRRMELARSALELAEQKLEIERGKLRLGLSSNFRLAEFQTDLLNAQVGELKARIDYLNAVAAHDRTVGTVLDRWDIDIAWAPAPTAPEGDG